MSATGPELPPHLLAKRKRQQAEEQKDEPATSSGANHDKRRRLSDPDLAEQSSSQPAGPQLPPASAPVPPPSESIPAPVRRVAGPAPPPAPLDERPTAPLDSDSEDSDDDFGPALPSAADAQSPNDHNGPSLPQAEAAPVRAQRDEWMTLPPQQDDLAARMDPSKLRARGFNTGKSARGGGAAGSASISAAWTETPEQKLKRLQDEAMGVKPVSVSGTDAAEAARSKEREAEANRLREKTVRKISFNEPLLQSKLTVL